MAQGFLRRVDVYPLSWLKDYELLKEVNELKAVNLGLFGAILAIKLAIGIGL